MGITIKIFLGLEFCILNKQMKINTFRSKKCELSDIQTLNYNMAN